MTNTKNERIFLLNKLVISAFENENSFDMTEIIKETKNLEQNINNSFKTQLQKDFDAISPNIINEQAAYKALFDGNITGALCQFSELYNKTSCTDYLKHLANCLLQLNEPEILNKYYSKKIKELAQTDNEALEILAATYFRIDSLQKKAIPLYKKLIKINPLNALLYHQLAFLYERVYQNKYLDKQIELTQKSLELSAPNNLIYAFLAKLYHRARNMKLAEKYFKLMMKNNPTPEEQVLYSRYFLSEGNLTKGYDLYRIRFETSNVAYPKELTDKTRWDGKTDISNSTVIVHYEQGFGDTIMFVRYIPKLAKMARKVILVVQKNIIPLLLSSGYDKYCEILSHEADVSGEIELENTNSSVMYSNGSGMSRIKHDFHIPMMDLPYLFKETPSSIYKADKYLNTTQEKVSEFKKKYINDNKKLKIGFAYHGTKQSNPTYRDIKVKEFIELFKMKDVEFYSLQADEHMNELKRLPKGSDGVKIYNLGENLKNFEDTACAMECMDLIISTDNVIMNLSGALGVKTFALFNVFPESRWFKTDGENIGWYKNVKPFKAQNYNDWAPLIKEIKKEILELVELKTKK